MSSPSSAGSTARRVAGPGAITPTGRLRVNTATNRRRVNRQLARQGSPQRFTTTGYLR